jgi:hypothetical protein
MTRIPSCDADSVKVQRLLIAALCLVSVLFQTPVPLYFVVLSIVPGILYGMDKEGISLFYRKLVRPAMGRSLFTFDGKATGLYLLGLEAETFAYSMAFLFMTMGITLAVMGVSLWSVPIAMVAAGMALAGTTGICLMGLIYLKARTLWRHE